MNTLRRVQRALNPAPGDRGRPADHGGRAHQPHPAGDGARSASHFKDRVFRTTSPAASGSPRRPSFGKPILLYDIRSKGAEAYLDLAKEVMAHEEKGAGQGALARSCPILNRRGRAERRAPRYRRGLEPNPLQPRSVFDAARLAELAASLRESGMVQPILVRRHGRALPDHRRRAALAGGPQAGPGHACRSSCARCPTTGCSSWRSWRTSSAQELRPLEEAQAYQRLQDEFSSPRRRSPAGWARTAPPSPTPCGCCACRARCAT